MHTVRLADGRRVGHTGIGPPGGEPVLYFHGALGSPLRDRASTEPVLDALGLRMILVDRPGFGLSDPHPGRTLLSWAADVEQLLDRLGLDVVRLLGVSAGGPYAVATARRLPERVAATALVGGFPPLDGRRSLREANLPTLVGLGLVRRAPRLCDAVGSAGMRFLHRRPDVLARAMAAGAGRGGLADGRSATEHLLAGTERGLRALIDDLRVVMRPWGFDPAEVAGEVHLWHGALDTTIPVPLVERLAARLPRCRAAFVPEEGHFFFRRWMGEVLATLAGRAAEPGSTLAAA